MLLSRIKAPDKTFCRLRVVYSQDQSPLSSLEKRLTLTIFKPFLIKSAEPVANGYVSVWRFPKADRHLATAFDALYLAVMGYNSLDQANRTEKAIDLERIEREKAKTFLIKKQLQDEANRKRQSDEVRRSIEKREHARRKRKEQFIREGETSLRRILAANRDPKPLE